MPRAGHERVRLVVVHLCGRLHPDGHASGADLHRYVGCFMDPYAAQLDQADALTLARPLPWRFVNIACGINQYSAAAGSVQCTACPAGSDTRSATAAASCQCRTGFATSGSGSSLACTGNVFSSPLRPSTELHADALASLCHVCRSLRERPIRCGR